MAEWQVESPPGRDVFPRALARFREPVKKADSWNRAGAERRRAVRFFTAPDSRSISRSRLYEAFTAYSSVTRSQKWRTEKSNRISGLSLIRIAIAATIIRLCRGRPRDAPHLARPDRPKLRRPSFSIARLYPTARTSLNVYAPDISDVYDKPNSAA